MPPNDLLRLLRDVRMPLKTKEKNNKIDNPCET
jgi:hypothetical protein